MFCLPAASRLKLLECAIALLSVPDLRFIPDSDCEYPNATYAKPGFIVDTRELQKSCAAILLDQCRPHHVSKSVRALLAASQSTGWHRPLHSPSLAEFIGTVSLGSSMSFGSSFLSLSSFFPPSSSSSSSRPRPNHLLSSNFLSLLTARTFKNLQGSLFIFAFNFFS